MTRSSFRLENVFNEAALPDVTFVEPKDFPYVRASLRTTGKHVTIVGPSGSGKSTLAWKAFAAEGVNPAKDVVFINGRHHAATPSFIEAIEREFSVPGVGRPGVTELLRQTPFVFVDDFHHMSPGCRAELAILLKPWAEEGIRILLVGIAASAEELLGADAELGIRNDPYEVKRQDDGFIVALLGKGEDALNFEFAAPSREDIVKASRGVPSVAQAIARVACVEHGVRETLSDKQSLVVDLGALREAVLRGFHPKFFGRVVGLCKGKQQARSVHNTYFEIVSAIASSGKSEVPLEYLRQRIVGSVTDTAERNRKSTSYYNCLKNLKEVIVAQNLQDVLLFNDRQNVISIEDPSFWFYLGLLDMDQVRKRVHVRGTTYPYDVAISFAGETRAEAQALARACQAIGLEVFYDFDQQHILWGKNLRQRLAEVYSQEALYMLVLISKHYPEKDWSAFELDVGRGAAKKRTQEYLLPVRLDDTDLVGLSKDVAWMDWRRSSVDEMAKALAEKIEAQEH
jgi:energy-coupling factor transporter ATP-binding protein EcfA2